MAWRERSNSSWSLYAVGSCQHQQQVYAQLMLHGLQRVTTQPRSFQLSCGTPYRHTAWYRRRQRGRSCSCRPRLVLSPQHKQRLMAQQGCSSSNPLGLLPHSRRQRLIESGCGPLHVVLDLQLMGQPHGGMSLQRPLFAVHAGDHLQVGGLPAWAGHGVPATPSPTFTGTWRGHLAAAGWHGSGMAGCAHGHAPTHATEHAAQPSLLHTMLHMHGQGTNPRWIRYPCFAQLRWSHCYNVSQRRAHVCGVACTGTWPWFQPCMLVS